MIGIHMPRLRPGSCNQRVELEGPDLPKNAFWETISKGMVGQFCEISLCELTLDFNA